MRKLLFYKVLKKHMLHNDTESGNCLIFALTLICKLAGSFIRKMILNSAEYAISTAWGFGKQN